MWDLGGESSRHGGGFSWLRWLWKRHISMRFFRGNGLLLDVICMYGRGHMDNDLPSTWLITTIWDGVDTYFRPPSSPLSIDRTLLLLLVFIRIDYNMGRMQAASILVGRRLLSPSLLPTVRYHHRVVPTLWIYAQGRWNQAVVQLIWQFGWTVTRFVSK